MFRVLAISGSLRKESFNTKLLQALPALAPRNMRLELFEGLHDVPLYNEDLDTDPALPSVDRFRHAIRVADGLVIATPEYNHSVPGVLKNAIDWASRPHGRAALTGKGIVVMVATLGRLNGFRCLSDACRLLTGLGNIVIPEPEVVVSSAPSALVTTSNDTVELSDMVTARLIRIQLEALADVLAADAGSSVTGAVERNRGVMHRMQFLPYVRQALAEGADPDEVVERLLSAGHATETVAQWLVEAQAANAV